MATIKPHKWSWQRSYGSSSRFEYNGRHGSGSGSTPSSRSPRSRHRSPNNKARRAPGRRSSSRAGRSSSPRTRSSSRSISRSRRSSSRRYRSISRGRRSRSSRRRARSPALRASSRSVRPSNGTQASNTYESQPLRSSNRRTSPHRSPKAFISISEARSIFASGSSVKRSESMAVDELAKKKQPRSLSRSSIASTHVSDREPSPPPDNLSPPSVSREPVTSEPSKAVEAKHNPSVNTDVQINSPCPPKVEDSLSGGILNDSIGSGTAASTLSSVCLTSPDLLKKQLPAESIIEVGHKPPFSPQSKSLRHETIKLYLRHLRHSPS